MAPDCPDRQAPLATNTAPSPESVKTSIAPPRSPNKFTSLIYIDNGIPKPFESPENKEREEEIEPSIVFFSC